MLAFLPILIGLVKGAALAPLLAGLNVEQWVSIAGTLVSTAPKVREELAAIHVVFAKLNADIGRGVKPGYAGKIAYAYMLENPPDEIDRTQEDINQDERIEILERAIRRVEQRLSVMEGKLLDQPRKSD
jgi:hypothetical protein